MSCTRPLKGFPIGYTENGKIKYKITSYSIDYILKTYDKTPKITCHVGEPFNPDKFRYKLITDWIEIPCGKCDSCRLKYSRQWADRCMLELEQHDEACFITLTYDDYHLESTVDTYIDELTGEFGEYASLHKEHVQLFIKNLRNYIKRNEDDRHIKYFCAGEYGSKTHRPHYHIIIFGWKPKDLVPYKQNFQGDWLYNSPTLNMCWKDFKGDGHPRGFVVVGDVTWNSCAYVARYILKKQYGADTDYEKYGFASEFTMMSLKPAIGREYFEKYGASIFETDHLSVSTPSGGRKIYPPRYFEKLYEDIDEDGFQSYKIRKSLAIESNKKLKGDLTSNNYLAMLKTQEAVVKARIQKLKRSV